MSRILEPVQLSPHVHVVYSEYPHVHSGNVYLITGARPILIDCGSSRAVPTLLRNLAHLGLAITDIDLVVATHGDYDHIQGYHNLRALHPGLSLAIHEQDRVVVQGNDVYRTSSYVYDSLFVPLNGEHCQSLGDGDLIPAGDGQLHVVHSPGHTDGSICLQGNIDGYGMLFAGDVYGGSMKSVDGADPAIWMQSLQTWALSLGRLAGLEFDWVLNGHEPAPSLPIPRSEFDQRQRMFGRMLNPWFALGDESSLVDPVEPDTLLARG
jgi:glyoxylase-like metal-dependent hydrolase (beta-lactamase superfamily II)